MGRDLMSMAKTAGLLRDEGPDLVPHGMLRGGVPHVNSLLREVGEILPELYVASRYALQLLVRFHELAHVSQSVEDRGQTLRRDSHQREHLVSVS